MGIAPLSAMIMRCRASCHRAKEDMLCLCLEIFRSLWSAMLITSAKYLQFLVKLSSFASITTIYTIITIYQYMQSTLMIRFKASLLATLLFACVSEGNGQKNTFDNLPPLAELFAVNDSVIKEGHRLYFFEKINWNVADFLFANHKAEEVGASLTYMAEDSLMIALFADTSIVNTVCELQWDMRTNQYNPIETSRVLTEREKELIERRKVIMTRMQDMADSINGIPQGFGNFNFDIIRINDNITRLYILTGTLQKNTIPFGNDYSIDFDNDNNIVAFRRYHNSLLAIQATYDGEAVTPIHSHLENNPYITPTDICNYLLYARDVFGIDTFMVYSTKFKTRFLYVDKMKSIITAMDNEKSSKKGKKKDKKSNKK